MQVADMTAKIAGGDGFIAALDQSGGSTPKALAGYGIEEGGWADEAGMYGLIHDMRVRIITSPAFTGEKVIGAILFERTMDGQADGKPVPQALIDRGVVPFIKIDKGLEAEADGVQMMKPMPGLDALLARAKGLGVFGTKERSVINLADPAGIAAIVAQQFAVGQQVLAGGLVPMLEPEINIKSPERAEADRILLAELLKALDAMPGTEKVMLKLSLPATPGAVPAARRSSARAARGGAIGRLQAARGVRRTGEESGDHRELQPRVARGSALRHERRSIRCIVGRRDRRHLHGIDQEGGVTCGKGGKWLRPISPLPGSAPCCRCRVSYLGWPNMGPIRRRSRPSCSRRGSAASSGGT